MNKSFIGWGCAALFGITAAPAIAFQSFNLAIKAIYQTHNQADVIIFPESAIPFHSTQKNAKQKKGLYSKTFDGMVRFLAKLSSAAIVYSELGYDNDKMFNTFSVQQADGNRSHYNKRNTENKFTTRWVPLQC